MRGLFYAFKKIWGTYNHYVLLPKIIPAYYLNQLLHFAEYWYAVKVWDAAIFAGQAATLMLNI